nr:hypothetical protein Iba_chr02aCG16520 [Ipomoea batatas]
MLVFSYQAKILNVEKCQILLPLYKLRRPPVRTLHFISEVQESSKLYYVFEMGNARNVRFLILQIKAQKYLTSI